MHFASNSAAKCWKRVSQPPRYLPYVVALATSRPFENATAATAMDEWSNIEKEEVARVFSFQKASFGDTPGETATVVSLVIRSVLRPTMAVAS